MPSTEIDRLAAKARRQAAKLNRTLDRLGEHGVSTAIGVSLSLFGGGSVPVSRVRLVLTDPAHKPEAA